MAVEMSEIKAYLEMHGPKKILNSEYSRISRVVKFGNPIYDVKYFQSRKARISEVLPLEGDIILSDSETKVVMYVDGKRGFGEAGFNIASGQPYIIGGNVIDYEKMVPVSSLKIINFSGSRPIDGREYTEKGRMSQASGFLEGLIDASKGFSVVEIDKNIGDNFSRFFPLRGCALN